MRLSYGLCEAPFLKRECVFLGNAAGGWALLDDTLAGAGVAVSTLAGANTLAGAIKVLSSLSHEQRDRLEAQLTSVGQADARAVGSLRQVEDMTKIMVVGGWDPASKTKDTLQHTTPHVMTRWMDQDDFKRQPITVFKKFPSAIAAPGCAIALPTVRLVGEGPISGKYVADAALVVVIGKPALRIDPAEANQHIFGVTLMLDVWNDDIFNEEARVRRGMVARNLTALSPVGPSIETMQDGHLDDQCELELVVDGVTRQRFRLGELAFSIPQVISFCSSVGLEPGDMIAFGARIANGSGAGPLETPAPIAPGQDIVVRGGRLCELSATVVAGNGYCDPQGEK